MGETQLKRILITGKGSYIGTSLEKWLQQWSDHYSVDTIDMIREQWRETSFAGYDVVFHVAGIAHVSVDPKMEALYYKVNRDLAIETAKKAKDDGVRQFIFMSSMIIYGNDSTIGEKVVITKDTIPQPSNFYGKSKLEADLAIQNMGDVQFKSVIIRTPMVYGPGCKGNFPKLVKLAQLCPIFPDIDNERSMIYIDNLCEFLRLGIDKEVTGVYFPQNTEYVSTKRIFEKINDYLGRKVFLVKWFNSVIKLLSTKYEIINKVFGNRVYDMELSKCDLGVYVVCDFDKSIERYFGR